MKSQLPLDQIIRDNCLEALKRLPEKSIDLIFADPPYNLQLNQELWRPNLTRVDAVDDAWDQFGSFADYDTFTRAWLQACRRVLKETGTIWVIGSYHNIYRVGAILMDLGYWILNDVIWVKTNPMPNFRGVRFTNAHETLIWAQKTKGKPYTFNYQTMKALNGGKQMRSDWLIPICSGVERLKVNGQKAHSTQKPEPLLERVILSSSKRGEIVLDPFLGTGTTAAVAKRLGRHWIGIEQDQAYVTLARARVESAALPDSESSILEDQKPARVPFVAVLERHLLEPGQLLYFRRRRDVTAVILADGQIRHGAITGSIHAVGSAIQQVRCNGWEHWYYVDPATGDFAPIDTLREHIREQG